MKVCEEAVPRKKTFINIAKYYYQRDMKVAIQLTN